MSQKIEILQNDLEKLKDVFLKHLFFNGDIQLIKELLDERSPLERAIAAGDIQKVKSACAWMQAADPQKVKLINYKKYDR